MRGNFLNLCSEDLDVLAAGGLQEQAFACSENCSGLSHQLSQPNTGWSVKPKKHTKGPPWNSLRTKPQYQATSADGHGDSIHEVGIECSEMSTSDSDFSQGTQSMPGMGELDANQRKGGGPNLEGQEVWSEQEDVCDHYEKNLGLSDCQLSLSKEDQMERDTFYMTQAKISSSLVKHQYRTQKGEIHERFVRWDNVDARSEYITMRLKSNIVGGQHLGTKFTPKTNGLAVKRCVSPLELPHMQEYSFAISFPSNSATGNYEIARSAEANASYVEVDEQKTIFRSRYYRGPTLFDSLRFLTGFELIYNDECDDHPYAPEFYLVEFVDMKDESGNYVRYRFNKTRRALCPYCPTLEFFLVNVSSYGQHVSQHHGVLSDGYFIPNPINPGKYIITKSNPHRKTRAKPRNARGVVCPVCYTVVEVESSVKTKLKQPLMGYFTHFKLAHSSQDKVLRNQDKLSEVISSGDFFKFRRMKLSVE